MIDYAIDVLIIILGFFLFSLSHSVLASFKIKTKAAKWLGNYIAFYRLFYNIISVILVFLLYLYLPKPDLIVYDLSYPYDFLILIPQFLSLAGLIWSVKYIGLKQFLGLDQAEQWFKNQYDVSQLDEKMTLTFDGPYKYVRHPIFLFGGLFILFRPVMGLFYLTCVICIILYIFIGSLYEEKRMIEKFGEKYIKYKKNIPGFFPNLFKPYKEEQNN
ncbi:MAG TPA: isoprenylcysteine carboxylmethyltransferase family protein [Ignavibacteriaceae bacterium]|nr:isoprenylcysteine carboxylmethyltransferase family protein [Ignavibacteriaceae bacterium]